MAVGEDKARSVDEMCRGGGVFELRRANYTLVDGFVGRQGGLQGAKQKSQAFYVLLRFVRRVGGGRGGQGAVGSRGAGSWKRVVGQRATIDGLLGANVGDEGDGVHKKSPSLLCACAIYATCW